VHISDLKHQEQANESSDNGYTSGPQNGPRVGLFERIKIKVTRRRQQNAEPHQWQPFNRQAKAGVNGTRSTEARTMVIQTSTGVNDAYKKGITGIVKPQPESTEGRGK